MMRLAIQLDPLRVSKKQQFAFIQIQMIIDISLFAGQLISIFRDGCRKAFQKQPQRLVTPMYSCSIIVSNEVLGKFNTFSIFIT